MIDATLKCIDERRRQMLRDQADRKDALHGIDFVEVIEGSQQRELCVHFFGNVPDLARANIRIEGGQRIREFEILEVAPHHAPDPEHRDCLRVLLNRAGDFSCYKLCLYEVDEQGLTTDDFLEGFDPRYVCAEFSFKVECPSELDCLETQVCLTEVPIAPEINYLAKDYSSFRQLLFDRLALLIPDWKERHVADIGVALVELLAYEGDYLSYYQDAVATEAYLDTSRQRTSVRRHARLVDYFLHEGCNARAWVAISTNQDVDDPALKLRDIYFSTGADENTSEVFEPVDQNPESPLQLFKAHNRIPFYTWGLEECCLPRGATAATLRDEWVVEPPPENPPVEQWSSPKQAKNYPPAPEPEPPLPKRWLQLKVGDVLILEEVIGPKTGDSADADLNHRHAVRLIKVTPGEDQLIKQKIQGSDQDWPTPLVEIEWAPEDALPFHLCLSARLPAPKCKLISDISVALGNVVLVDHGRTIETPEDLGQVGKKGIHGECRCEGSVMDLTTVPDTFRPVLEQTPLTFSEPVNRNTPASLTLKQDPRNALPQILSLVGLPGKCEEPVTGTKPKPLADIDPANEKWRWNSRLDLLGSGSLDQHYVVEIDNDGKAHLRFGNGELGRVPAACMIFQALYRVGNGTSGNVGADTINTVGWRQKSVSGLTLVPRNPMPSIGGTPPESLAEAKLFAPSTFLKQLERAVTADDYARLARRYPRKKVQRAGGSLRWTGSWYAAQVSIDPLGAEAAGGELLNQIKDYLFRYRRMGHDLEVQPARYVPLRIEMKVCVLPHYLRGHVQAALLQVFSNRTLPDGTLGFFHPDNLTFAEGIYLSKLVAAAQAVTGVESVEITTLQRLGDLAYGELEEGILKLGPLEVAQLDNDPNFPERGVLKISLRGGR
ncbi:MAG: putative baseplate assembly protein [Pyrinomonadaceae bacterium]